jgi:tetratricopeptide (TPR) repeat protein
MSDANQRDEQLFAEALARPEPEWAAFLKNACGGDAALRDRIVALLKAHAGPESLLASVPSVVRDAVAAEEKPGDLIDRYKLLEKLGEGGCGAVWAAEQREPVKRRVALKIIKLGMDTHQVIARFEAERQALAMMDHPNIAKMLDAGATATGRPYFVMELVRGIPITTYCDENNLPTPRRIELFMKVCHAIQHAHQKGIIHRDIKPSNVLVTLHDGVPVPKVIDFGIAKATQQELTEKTVYTKFQQFIGTPAYMSPEQAEMSGLDIDTRSDIYSLGVLLYELVTGRTPFDSKELLQQGVDDLRRTIRETEPPRPSTRIRTLRDEELTNTARRRSTDARRLIASLRGDVDWIVMRCLEKDRTRRYDTANGLATDLLRHLANEPVIARPPSAAYLLRKFIRRHRFGFAAAVALFGAVTLGAVVSTWQAVRATNAEREQTRLRAESEAARDRAVVAEEAQRIGRKRAEAAESAAQLSAASARESERLAAEARRNAEALLLYVFTDLGEQLSAFGQLEILDQITRKAVAYYDGLPAALQPRETRASHALAIAGVGKVGGWLVSETIGNAHVGQPAARAQLQRAVNMIEDFEATGPMTPLLRLSAATVWYVLAHQYYREGRAGRGSVLERAEGILVPALHDSEWGDWSRHLMISILAFQSVDSALGSNRAVAKTRLPVLERALEYAEQADHSEVRGHRRGLRAAEIWAWYAEALFVAGERTKARQINAANRARLSELVQREPFLASARNTLAFTGRTVARRARAEWDFAAWQSALDEMELHYTELLKHHPTHWTYATMFARSLAYGADSRRTYELLSGDFAAAKAATEKALKLWDVEWTPPGSLFLAREAWNALAWICAATGDDEEVIRHLQRANALWDRQREASYWLTEAERHTRFPLQQPGRSDIEFQRLNWLAMRSHAEQVLRSVPGNQSAHRDLMRAAFEMGDYATARHTLEDWAPGKDPLPPTDEIQQRFNRLGDLLLRIHVLARGGEEDFARAELARIWPEVEAVFAAGPDYLFNQVQTARALLIRAELEGDATTKGEWLERAAGYLRPAAAAGRLTRYEREVLLANIERQLTQAPVASIIRTP